MRVIDFQDGLYRSQPTEKLYSRVVNQPMDDVHMAQLKKMQDDALKQTHIEEARKAKEKLVDKDKEEREQGKQKKRNKSGAAEAAEKKARRRPSDGNHLIDVDA
jgi:hypothetical protein